MKFRKLRIAWSVAWGLLALLLVVLWVWSGLWFNQIIRETSPTNYYVAVTSASGQIAVGGANEPLLSTIVTRDWAHRRFAMKGVYNETGSPIPVFPVNLPNSAMLLRPYYKSPFVAGPLGS